MVSSNGISAAADSCLGQVLLCSFVLVVCALVMLSLSWASGGDDVKAVSVSTQDESTAQSLVSSSASSGIVGGTDIAAMRTIPGYCVVFVDKAVDAMSVLRVFSDAGCTGVISAANAESEVLPLPDASLLPVELASYKGLDLMNGMIMADAGGYPASRGEYFRDASGKYSLYYVPEQFKSAINKCVAAMSGADAGVIGQRVVKQNKHSAARFVAVIMIAAVIFCVMSGNVVRSILSFALPVLFAMVCNGAEGITRLWTEISAASALCAVFAARTLWTRPHSVSSVVKSGVSPAFAAVSLVTGIIGGAGFLSAAVLVGSFAALRVHYLIKSAMEHRHLFCPVPILSSKVKWGAAEGMSVGMGALMCVLFPVMSMGMADEAVVQDARPDVQLPYTLPTVDDYCRWCWRCVTYPYIRLENTVVPPSVSPQFILEGDYIETDIPDTVSFPSYKEENGVIKQSVIEMKMDDDFKAKCIAAIDQLPDGAVEHLMAVSRSREGMVRYSQPVDGRSLAMARSYAPCFDAGRVLSAMQETAQSRQSI